MKRETVNYFAAGLFVLAAIAVLLVVLYRVGGGSGARDLYYTSYRNVAGLSRGTLVSYEGYVFGSVGDIEPGRDAEGVVYRVQLRIEPGWEIPEDSVARITSAGLLADTVVDIQEGDSDRFLAPGDTLKGENSVDVFVAMGEIAGEFSQLSKDGIRPLLASLNGTVQQLGGELNSRLPAIMKGMEDLVAKLDHSATILSTVLNERSARQAQRVLDNVDLAAADLGKLTAGLLEVQAGAGRLIRDLDGLVVDSRPDLQAAVADLRQVLEDVSRYSEGILYNLDGTSRNMNEFSRQIRENPGRLLGGAAQRDQGGMHE